MTYTFKRKLMNINKSPRRIKRDAGEEIKIQLLNSWGHPCINLKLNQVKNSTLGKKLLLNNNFINFENYTIKKNIIENITWNLLNKLSG